MNTLKAAEGTAVTESSKPFERLVEAVARATGQFIPKNAQTSGVSTDDNFRDFNIIDKVTGGVKQLEIKPYEQTVAQKVKGGFVRGQGAAIRGGGCAMKGKKR